jgi:hypothetical protein
MTKWLIIFALIFLLISMIALRYRRQIQTALHIWKMFRQFKKAAKPPEKKIENRKADQDEQLVRCAKCGKWVSQTNALDLRSKTFYCSTECMEKAARIESLVDRN